LNETKLLVFTFEWCIAYTYIETMRKIISFVLLGLFFTVGACTTVRVHNREQKQKNMPPGQAKKMTGEKSAKRHAPGQRKKG